MPDPSGFGHPPDLLSAWRDWDHDPTNHRTANRMEDVCQQLNVNRNLLGVLRRLGWTRPQVVAFVVPPTSGT